MRGLRLKMEDDDGGLRIAPLINSNILGKVGPRQKCHIDLRSSCLEMENMYMANM